MGMGIVRFRFRVRVRFRVGVSVRVRVTVRLLVRARVRILLRVRVRASRIDAPLTQSGASLPCSRHAPDTHTPPRASHGPPG